MINIFKKTKNLPNRMTSVVRAGNRGFVILFAVTISSILLSIALGVANISLNELRFSTSARATNDAFFAADTGAECALLYDREDEANNAFTGSATINCAGAPIVLDGFAPTWTFIIPNLGSTGESCSKVTVYKNVVPPNIFTTITAKGFNIGDANCESTSLNRIEREIRLSY